MIYYNNTYTKILHKEPHQECIRCVMDTSDPWITFNEDGLCNHCQNYDNYINQAGNEEVKQKNLEQLTNELKLRGRGKEYDCIMGLSGGVDSSYLAWFAVKKLNLRPLVVHVDAGWNSELAVNNIQNIVQKLNLDMHTLVVDWPEVRDLQQAYFRSGIANLDVPQDHAFIACLYTEANKFGIRDVLNGGNMQTESILPQAWGYDAEDIKSLKAIHKKYGKIKLKKYPTLSSFKRFIYYPYIKKMKVHRPLEWIDYKKETAKKILIEELGWRDYGGKHYESVFTKFFQAYILPTKFGYDKRLAHLSSLIVSEQITKEEAKSELQKPLYDPLEFEEDKIFWIKKLGFSEQEFETIMKEKPTFFSDYDNNLNLYKKLRGFLQIASKIKRFIKFKKRD